MFIFKQRILKPMQSNGRNQVEVHFIMCGPKSLLAYTLTAPIVATLVLLALLLVYTKHGDFVGREACQSLFTVDTISSMDPNIVSSYVDLTSTLANPKLKIEGCEAICGKGSGI